MNTLNNMPPHDPELSDPFSPGACRFMRTSKRRQAAKNNKSTVRSGRVSPPFLESPQPALMRESSPIPRSLYIPPSLYISVSLILRRCVSLCLSVSLRLPLLPSVWAQHCRKPVYIYIYIYICLFIYVCICPSGLVSLLQADSHRLLSLVSMDRSATEKQRTVASRSARTASSSGTTRPDQAKLIHMFATLSLKRIAEYKQLYYEQHSTCTSK